MAITSIGSARLVCVFYFAIVMLVGACLFDCARLLCCNDFSLTPLIVVARISSLIVDKRPATPSTFRLLFQTSKSGCLFCDCLLLLDLFCFVILFDGLM